MTSGAVCLEKTCHLTGETLSDAGWYYALRCDYICCLCSVLLLAVLCTRAKGGEQSVVLVSRVTMTRCNEEQRVSYRRAAYTTIVCAIWCDVNPGSRERPWLRAMQQGARHG